MVTCMSCIVGTGKTVAWLHLFISLPAYSSLRSSLTSCSCSPSCERTNACGLAREKSFLMYSRIKVLGNEGHYICSLSPICLEAPPVIVTSTAKGMDGAENRQWRAQMLKAAASQAVKQLLTATAAFSNSTISTLHLGLTLYLLSYYEVAQPTDDLPVTTLEWHQVSVIQFS